MTSHLRIIYLLTYLLYYWPSYWSEVRWKPAFGKAKSSAIRGGGNRLVEFWYWIWLRCFFGWVGWLMSIYRELYTCQIEYPTYPQIYLFINSSIILLTYLLIWSLHLFLFFWLGSAIGHRLHTSTTIFFHY